MTKFAGALPALCAIFISAPAWGETLSALEQLKAMSPPGSAVSVPAIARSAAVQPEPVEKGWQRIGEEDGITSYQKEVPGSRLVSFMGVGEIDASIDRVVSVVIDESRASEWLKNFEVRRLRAISATERVVYQHLRMPFILRDRDFVLHATLEFDPARKTVLIAMQSVVDSAQPPTDCVRGELMRGRFEMTALDQGRKTRIVAEMHGDPKGGVPKWVVNLFQKNWPHSTLMGLRRQAAKKDLVVDPDILKTLTEDGYFN